MVKKILYIKPTNYNALNHSIKEYLEKHKDANTEIDVVNISKGPKHLEYMYYESLVSLEILRLVKEAENKGYDGAIIGCFYDPVLYAAREICEHILVSAPAESSMHIAATLGRSFSIIIGRNKWILKTNDNVHKYCFADKLASFRSVNLGVLDFHADPTHTEQMMLRKLIWLLKKTEQKVLFSVALCSLVFLSNCRRNFLCRLSILCWQL